MTKPIKNLVVKIGSYTDRNGESKNKYLNVGTLMETADGNKFILLNRSFNPAGVPVDDAGKETILISMFNIDRKQTGEEGAGGKAENTQNTQGAPAKQNEIPF